MSAAATASSEKTTGGLANLRPYQKGQSGNPNGRPKAAYDVAALAQEHTPKAINALVLALGNAKTRVPAAVALLDRAWGKPLQQIHQQNQTTVLHLLAAQQVGEAIVGAMSDNPSLMLPSDALDDAPTE